MIRFENRDSAQSVIPVFAAAVGDAQRGIIGTPAKIAPEQDRGEEVDGRADIYSLGLVLWELLVGARVRIGDDRNAMVAAARNNELPACSAETIPEPLRRIVVCATASDVADRFASARDMLEALDTYIVATRAASAEGSPRNAITAWLALTWQGEQDATAQADIAAPGVIVTFLDDGVAGVLGTATQHSVASTANDEPSLVVAAGPTALSAAIVASAAPAASIVAGPPITPSPRASDAGSSPPGPSRARVTFIISTVSIVALAGVFIAGRSLGKRNASDATLAAQTLTSDAATRATLPSDSVTNPDAPADAPVLVATRADAAFLSAAFDAVPTRPPHVVDTGAPRGAVRTATADATTPAVAAYQRVQFGAKPWAYVTIDGVATVYETPATVELTVGTHRLAFTNPALGASKNLTINVSAAGDNRFVVDLTTP